MITKDTEILRIGYSTHKYKAEQLAKKVLDYYYKESPPEFPINIFKMLKDLGVFYEFRSLDKLEGAYSPEYENIPPAVLINKNRPFSRQRFTAAHELCHHLKDFQSEMISIPHSKTTIEKYANAFANNLLMPNSYFFNEADKLANHEGHVAPDDAFKLCHVFGTSYSAVMWKLYYNERLSFKPSKKFFNGAKASQKLGNIGNLTFLRTVVDSYEYFPVNRNGYMWLKFQNELVFNDNRLEGLDISIEDTSIMLTDLRIKGVDSIYYEDFITKKRAEVIGHSYIYRYVYEKKSYPDRYELLKLHKILFSLSPYSEDMGSFRKIDNSISGATISTTHWSKIEEEIFLVKEDIKFLYEKKNFLTISEYLSRAVNIHHKLTQIHPFEDGNGRVIRAILNWLLKLKKLPPIYIDYQDKDKYVEALVEADNYNNEPMEILFLKQLLSSFIQLNEEHSLIYQGDLEFYETIQETN